ncbi:MAG TPA: hypothetical protein VG186_15295 [Solirubrobacteraceae bacterium]|nr:hypothetical protein [Solirubrobacteraceae bacterium]
MFTVVERRAISEELALAADRWLAQHGLGEEVDEGWLELVCEDGDVFRPDNIMLHLAVPPCEVAPGDSVDPSRTQTVARLWPEVGAPADEVPRDLALARTFERRESLWVGACELPGPVRELFRVEDPAAMLAVMNATRRTLNRGAMNISGDPAGRLSFTLVDGDVAAWGSIEARVPEAFSYWLDAGPAGALAEPLRDATYAVGSLGGLDDLIVANQEQVQARCPLEEDRPAPEPLPADYFENHFQGGVEGLRIDRAGGLGREALAAIAGRSPGEVSFAIDDDGSLVISDAFKLPGPGFTWREDGQDVPIAVPYVVALAIYDGAAAGPVELAADARWGRLHRADHGVTVQWARP